MMCYTVRVVLCFFCIVDTAFSQPTSSTPTVQSKVDSSGTKMINQLNQSQLFFTKPKFELRNRTKPGAVKAIRQKKIELHVDESFLNPEALSRFNHIECMLDSLTSDSIFVTLLGEEVDIEYHSKFQSNTTTYFTSSFNKPQKSIALKNVMYLQMRTMPRKVFLDVGTLVMAGGIALVVSTPFVGLQMSGDAKTELRQQLFQIGTACIGLSLPLFVLARPRKFAMSAKYNDMQKNYWLLQQH